jgi:hypothetical protein
MGIGWYYGRGADISGPVSGKQLVELANAGTVLPSDTVWQDGIEMGVRAAKVAGLFPGQPAKSSIGEAEPASVVGAADSPVDTDRTKQTAADVTVLAVSPVLVETVPDKSASPEAPTANLLPPTENVELMVLDEPPKATEESEPVRNPVRKGRAVAGRGAIIVGQDGTSVRYQMKCTTCGQEDRSWKTMTIKRGTMRVNFYCPKCRRRSDGEIHGTL